MDLSTFRTFLCKEAQLRLSTLGPGWSNAVKEESQWRLEMYRKFLERVRAGSVFFPVDGSSRTPNPPCTGTPVREIPVSV